jgi:ribose transport system permease protein
MRLWLEDKLRPAALADPWSRDALSVVLLLVLTVVLAPAWGVDGENFHQVVVGEMTSWLLLPALGFLLALRVGAIDLSVWAAAGVGGLVAAALMARGVNPTWALAAAAGAGLAFGAVNGALVAWVGVPSPVATVLTALAATWAARAAVPGGQIEVPESAVLLWVGWHPAPALALRVLAVSVIYLPVLVAMMAIDAAAWRRVRLPRRGGAWAALAACGMLAALGGAFWLLDSRWAPVPARLIGDLRIPAAALLAGGALLARPGRELLAGLSLPVAMLIVTVWRQKVWLLPNPWAFEFQVLVLLCMAGGVQLALVRLADSLSRPGRRGPALAAATLSVAGLALVASAATPHAFLPAALLRAGGLVLWLAGLATTVWTFRPSPAPGGECQVLNEEC